MKLSKEARTPLLLAACVLGGYMVGQSGNGASIGSMLDQLKMMAGMEPAAKPNGRCPNCNSKFAFPRVAFKTWFRCDGCRCVFPVAQALAARDNKTGAMNWHPPAIYDPDIETYTPIREGK